MDSDSSFIFIIINECATKFAHVDPFRIAANFQSHGFDFSRTQTYVYIYISFYYNEKNRVGRGRDFIASLHFFGYFLKRLLDRINLSFSLELDSDL